MQEECHSLIKYTYFYTMACLLNHGMYQSVLLAINMWCDAFSYSNVFVVILVFVVSTTVWSRVPPKRASLKPWKWWNDITSIFLELCTISGRHRERAWKVWPLSSVIFIHPEMAFHLPGTQKRHYAYLWHGHDHEPKFDPEMTLQFEPKTTFLNYSLWKYISFFIEI